MAVKQEPVAGSAMVKGCVNMIAHPRSSRNRHMTLATTSSFLSNGFVLAPLLVRVRFASSPELVAPRHSAKSMVDD